MNSKQIISVIEITHKITYDELRDLLFKVHYSLYKEKNILLYNASIISEKQKNCIYLTCVFHASDNNEACKLIFSYLKKFFHNNELCVVQYLPTLSIINNITGDEVNFENFVANNLDIQNMFYKPQNIEINRLLKKAYYHFNNIKGKVIWNNFKPIKIEKGKYIAKELYCELNLDKIITKSGYKVTNDALVFVESDNIFPYYKDKSLVLCVEEIVEKDKYPELLPNKYRLILN